LPYDSLSGLELFGIRFARDFLDRGLPAVIASPPDGPIAKQCRERGVPWASLSVLWRWDPRAVARLSDFLQNLRPRAVVGFRTQTAYPFHFAKLLTRSHTPFLLFYRLGAGNQPRRDPVHRVLFRHLAAVVSNSDHVRNKILLKWAIAPEKVVCIKSGIDLKKYRPDAARRTEFRHTAGIPEDAFLVGNTGRIHPEKGSQILIETLFGAEGPGRGRPDLHLVYVGREHFAGYAEKLHRKAEELGAGKQLHIVPFRNDIEAVYPAFDLFAMAVTAVETYAYVALEAMACGVVPIIPETGGMKEMLVNGREGFFYKHRNRESLRQTLSRAINLPADIRQKMSEAARDHMEKTASWKTMMTSYLDLFGRLGISLESVQS